MRRPLTTESLFTEMQRLNSVFGKFGNAEELSRATAAYKEALADLDLEQVQGAVTLALKHEPRFPYPSKLREHAKTWVGANRIEVDKLPRKATDDDIVCRICGSQARWAWVEAKDLRTGEERMVKRCIAPCDETRHPLGGWYIPAPANFVAWVEDEEWRAQPARMSGEGVL